MSDETENANDSGSEFEKSYTITVNGAEVHIGELSENEYQRRRWEAFSNRFKDENQVLIVVRSPKYHKNISMTIMREFGTFDEGLWDVFNPGGERTIMSQLKERMEENDPSPVQYIIGFKDSVPAYKIKEFKKEVNKLKLIS